MSFRDDPAEDYYGGWAVETRFTSDLSTLGSWPLSRWWPARYSYIPFAPAAVGLDTACGAGMVSFLRVGKAPAADAPPAPKAAPKKDDDEYSYESYDAYSERESIASEPPSVP